MILGFHHPGIVVPDLEKARDFYCKMFGFEVQAEETWQVPNSIYDQGVGLMNSAARGYILKGINCYLELWKYQSPTSQGDPAQQGANDYGIRHLCFQVDDARSEFERLKTLGGIAMNEPVDTGDGYAVYARDPFGNIIELSEIGGPCRPLPELEGLSRDGNYQGPHN